MKVVLANPPWREGENYGVRAGSRWPHFRKVTPGRKIPAYIPFPFYLAYAAAVLEAERHEVKLIDAIASGLDQDEFVSEVVDFTPPLIVLEVSTPSIYHDLKTASQLKARLPKTKVVFCGPHAPMSNPQFLAENQDVDLVMFGEYEYTLRDLIQNWDDFSSIKGLIFRDDEKVIVNPPRPLIADIDALPNPARHHLPMYNYCDAPAGLPLPSTVIWASRGCPFQCIFCVWPQLMYGGGNYRVRSPQNVVDEMEYLVKEYGFKSVNFDDDTFNLGRSRMLAIAAEISDRKLDIPWAIMARADTMDEEILSALGEAGLYSLKYGVESGSQELVNRAGKKLDLEKVKEVVNITKRLGIKVHLTFSFGLPGENWQTVDQTIRFAKELDPFSAQFSIVTPYPGSSYYAELDKEGKLNTKDWSKYVGSSEAVFSTAEMSAADLAAARQKAVHEWQIHVINRKLANGFAQRATTNLPPENVTQIIILRTSPLPHLYAAIKAVKACYPLARLTVVVQETIMAELIEEPDIDRLITVGEGYMNWEDLSIDVKEFIGSEQADLILCLYGSDERSAYCDIEAIMQKSKARCKGGLTLEGEFLALK